MLLPIEALQERICNSELGQEWINDPLMNQDVWFVETLGFTKEQAKARGIKNIYFESFSLPWLKLLAKLTIKATAREKSGLNSINRKIVGLRQLDDFLISKGIGKPELITNAILQEFISSGSQDRLMTINYIVQLWAEERWLKLDYVNRKRKKSLPKIDTIPEEVLNQIYENLNLFPAPLERLFRLQLVLGCRIGELLKMPRQCLKQESKKWFLLRWIEKRKYWRLYQIHQLVAELVREQQKFLDTQFGQDSDFDKLFCNLSTKPGDGASYRSRFEVKPVYFPELLPGHTINRWIKDFREKAHLKDRHNNQFELKSHMFRRTKASIMAYCEAEDEYIAAVLGHGSLDMLPHYRKRSLERLEKEAKAKGYVDMYGRITSFKPRKRRYEKLAEIIETKITTSLGECHRPSMLGDCQNRYACLGCGHHRVTEEDKPKIEADINNLERDLEQAETVGQERRITEINRILELLKNRLQGLKNLKELKQEKKND